VYLAPCLVPTRSSVRYIELPVLVFQVFYVDMYYVTYFKLGIVSLFIGTYNTFSLIFDIYNYFFLGNVNYRTFHRLALLYCIKRVVIKFVKFGAFGCIVYVFAVCICGPVKVFGIKVRRITIKIKLFVILFFLIFGVSGFHS